jgi:hypothetical protein
MFALQHTQPRGGSEETGWAVGDLRCHMPKRRGRQGRSGPSNLVRAAGVVCARGEEARGLGKVRERRQV